VTYQAAVTALIGLAVMLALVATYATLARRHRFLWHPLSIVFVVAIVGIVVSVVGELFRGGGSGVPVMLRRSAIGSFGWAVIIAIAVWLVRRIFVSRTKHS
jgi:hypothetical protein